MELSSIAMDPARCEQGVWFDYLGGARLLIARYGNVAWESKVRALVADVAKEARSGDLAPAASDDIDYQAAAHHLLLGWEGVTDGGKPLPYTPERGLTMFRDPRFREFYRYVLNCSQQRARYQAEIEEESLGNSEESSGGTSSGDTSRTLSEGSGIRA